MAEHTLTLEEALAHQKLCRILIASSLISEVPKRLWWTPADEYQYLVIKGGKQYVTNNLNVAVGYYNVRGERCQETGGLSSLMGAPDRL